jgi:hypothetical protein
VLTAVERVDIIVLVDADRGDVGVELRAGRELRPIVADLVAIAVRSEDDRHGLPLFISTAKNSS